MPYSQDPTQQDEGRSDHYETLQVSPRADQETIERVFRHLAKRFHPDNSETGDGERFTHLVEAYRVLSDPEQRAAYDAGYSEMQQERWQIFDQESSSNNVEADRRIRLGILTVLYQARRRDVDRPGLGMLDMERLLDCPQDHMEFHLWYLKQKGWLDRLDNGTLAITVDGIDYLNQQEIPWVKPERRLRAPAAEAGQDGEPDAAREAGPVRQAGPASADSEGSTEAEGAPKASPEAAGHPAANGATPHEAAAQPTPWYGVR